MSLETLALKGDPLNDDDVLRAASKANELAELVKDARALASALRLFKLACSNSDILTFRILSFKIHHFTHLQPIIFNDSEKKLKFRILEIQNFTIVVVASSAGVRRTWPTTVTERCGTADP